MKASRGQHVVPLQAGIHWPSSLGTSFRTVLESAPSGATVSAAAGGLVTGLFRRTRSVAGGVETGAKKAYEQSGSRNPLLERAKAVAAAATQPAEQNIFGRFQDQARVVGSRGAGGLLHKQQTASIQAEAAALPRSRVVARYHAVGHSLGCQVVCAAVSGGRNGCRLRRHLHSLVLIQAAMPANAFPPDGEYPDVLGIVAGVTLVTHSSSDDALGLYKVQHGQALGAIGAQPYSTKQIRWEPVALELHMANRPAAGAGHLAGGPVHQSQCHRHYPQQQRFVRQICGLPHELPPPTPFPCCVGDQGDASGPQCLHPGVDGQGGETAG